jgi:uncharacterized membrane protein YgcG
MNKLHHPDRIVVFTIAVIFGTIITGCGSSQQLISTWQNHEIKINGDQSEWKNALFQVPDKKVFIGFNNDDKFLYLFLKTNDRAKVIQMFRAGFITWFEPENSDYKPFGISFPQPNVFSDQQQFKQNYQGVNSESNPQEENPDNFMDKMIIQQTQLEIVNTDKYPLMALPLINKDGIEAKLSVKDNYFVYELKVPLAIGNEYSYTAGVKPGNTIKVRFETEKLEMAKKESSDQGERSPDSDAGQVPRGSGGGGMRGHGGGGMHSGGRSGGGRGTNNIEPFNYSVEVKLENAPKSN